FHMIGEEPVQRVHEQIEIKSFAELFQKRLPEGPPEAILKSIIRPFDLSQAPLLRAGLVKLGEAEHILWVDMHHIISDGVSIQVLVQDFSALYAGKELPGITLQYKDYAEWQNRERVHKKIREQGEYWKNEFAGEIPILELPVDFARPDIQAFEGDRLHFEIDSATSAALQALVQGAGATLYIVLLTLYNILLAKLANREDIVVGSPVAGRRHADLEKIIGMFVNTLALRNYPAGEKEFVFFLQEVKENTLKALENQEYQYEDLVEEVTVTRDVSRNPLFDTMLALQNTGSQEIAIPDLQIVSEEMENKTAKFDLSLTAVEVSDKLSFTFEYSTKLFKPATIERFIVYFKNLVKDAIDGKHRKIFQLEILTEAEKRQILFAFNDTEISYPQSKTIHQLFADQVKRTPDNIALVGADPRVCPNCLTYRQLNKQSDALATRLIEKGVGPDTIAAIKIERSLEMIIAIFGILKAGAAYLPIDPEYPQERIDYILKDSAAKILLTPAECVFNFHHSSFIIHHSNLST
ncbi:MAG TPA: condensation domain-containing protein, partial [Candidatus Deferrimicrobium sp.]|nr:condensation domain-containing protein [Candidatus Deferrimicrobium sp.]